MTSAAQPETVAADDAISSIAPTPDGALPITERGRRKRAAIVTAARDVFERSGFKDARIADITKRAKASYGSFYTYFDSKEEVFREVVREVTSEMFDASQPGKDAADHLERIERANRNYVESYARNARMLAVMEEVAAYDEFTAQLSHQIRQRFVDRSTEGIKRLQARGLADPTVDADRTADALGGMIERFAQVWVPLADGSELEAGIAVLTDIWARAIGLRRTAEGS